MSRKLENGLYVLLGVIIPAVLFVLFVYFNVNILFIIILLTYTLAVVFTFYGSETKSH
ncbi:MAG: hypothetical protein M1422_04275 [Candidatus Thermoplasmatota archaeon]|jgi:hypothetical protein|nr:hypothetical protein [Candidatus Sysuiplasma jiujiangense]MBX8639939.1 hypothetical protein [Candidatus Sysuiplasma jiujiangense]MBX8641150.1 hypothetical protein [Candidatus Sysuiplasma jiujiangense]MCL4317470.1 hypothetical protein [Candidatus Thermoplasmatota archaeon]MCL5678154.1 hypothetical protein [Candidatus Thermoplasmatota archaeon]